METPDAVALLQIAVLQQDLLEIDVGGLRKRCSSVCLSVCVEEVIKSWSLSLLD